MSQLPCNPFENSLFLGSACEVRPDELYFDLERPIAEVEGLGLGDHHKLGEVGQFICVEAPEEMVFGRIISVSGESDRRVARAHLLTSVSLVQEQDLRGINLLPALGANVYAAQPSLVAWLARGISNGDASTPMRIGHLPVAPDESVRLEAGQLFGRGCAVFGSSGSGKSWTIARLLEQASEYRAKTILLDATGEYHTLRRRTMHAHIGSGEGGSENAEEVAFPHRELVEDDLFAMFTPSGEIQGPRMRSAIRSLKLANMLGPENGLVIDGCIPKAGRGKQLFNDAYAKHAAELHQPAADFDISLLPRQIELECVWPSTSSNIQGARDHTVWGEENPGDIAQCDSLVSRIQGFLQADEFKCLFSANGTKPLPELLDEFMTSDEHTVLRISMKYLSFTMHVREIVANAIGRLLLRRARRGDFSQQPVVLFLDEAHQFLNKALGDEHARYPLDAYELIAKEGRKYSLSLCISTQRPSDIPEGVLSQVGTQIVHRLVNRRDRDAVEAGITHLDQSAARFLPTFSPGEAVIVGVYTSIPLSVQVSPPEAKPDSRGADYDRHWGAKSGELSLTPPSA